MQDLVGPAVGTLALVALGGSWKHQAVRLAAGGLAGVAGFLIFSGPWMLYMYQLTGNPLFPYWNDYWRSPLALPAAYRDLRFVPAFRPWWQQLPSCGSPAKIRPVARD